MCVRWLVYVTQSCAWQNALAFVLGWERYRCAWTDAFICVWHDTFIYGWDSDVCNMASYVSRSRAWHVCVWWLPHMQLMLIQMCATCLLYMINSCVWKRKTKDANVTSRTRSKKMKVVSVRRSSPYFKLPLQTWSWIAGFQSDEQLIWYSRKLITPGPSGPSLGFCIRALGPSSRPGFAYYGPGFTD